MSTATDIALAIAGPLLGLVKDVVEGRVSDPKDAARALVGIAANAASPDELKEYLEDEARMRQDLAFEAAKAAKFSGG